MGASALRSQVDIIWDLAKSREPGDKTWGCRMKGYFSCAPAAPPPAARIHPCATPSAQWALRVACGAVNAPQSHDGAPHGRTCCTLPRTPSALPRGSCAPRVLVCRVRSDHKSVCHFLMEQAGEPEFDALAAWCEGQRARPPVCRLSNTFGEGGMRGGFGVGSRTLSERGGCEEDWRGPRVVLLPWCMAMPHAARAERRESWRDATRACATPHAHELTVMVGLDTRSGHVRVPRRSSAKFDWENDSRDRAYISHDDFFKTVFEVADMWTTSQNPKEYVVRRSRTGRVGRARAQRPPSRPAATASAP
eukprot:2612553-Prymnesium_polylepis.1